MTLEEQWEEDVKTYINPEKMWEGGVTSYNSYGDIEFSGIVQMPEGIEFNEFVKGMDEVWRKQSAALTFDLVAARAGDEVETRPRNERLDWITVTFIEQCNDTSSIQFWIEYKGLKYRAYLSDLRMKHPRRVGVDYSQFEDKP